MEYSFQKNMRLDLMEKMDEPGVKLSELKRAHRELQFINEYLGGYNLLIESLDEINQFYRIDSLLDIGCGSGDNLRVVAEHFRNRFKDVNLYGVDINPEAVNMARHRSLAYPEIRFKTADVWDKLEPADVVTCSLFCHHFNDEKIVQLINKMIDTCEVAVVINDLHRNWFAFHSISLLTRLFSRSTLVKYDAPLSVARSFSKEDWDRILSQCNFSRYTLRWKWAWRWQLIIYK